MSNNNSAIGNGVVDISVAGTPTTSNSTASNTAMSKGAVKNSAVAYDRLLSLDFFRGLTMLFLMGEAAQVYEAMVEPAFDGSLMAMIGINFHHHPWHGLRFWDLVQPFFMFIVGVAMPFSFQRRFDKGDSWGNCFQHVINRSGLMLMFGLMLHIYYAQKIVFEFQNVLSQLAVTYLLAFLVIRFSAFKQVLVTVGLLLLTEYLYRGTSIPGFDIAFAPDRNFGAYVDMLLSGHISGGHWVAFNAIPTAAHTIWGVLAGQLLMSAKSAQTKTLLLIGAGALCLLLGYSLDMVTPIIKRISTTSFTIVSGGWCLLALALSYWVIDVKGNQKYCLFAIVVGMNPLFIYLFFSFGGAEYINAVTGPFVAALFSGFGQEWIDLAASLLVWFMLWMLCFLDVSSENFH